MFVNKYLIFIHMTFSKLTFVWIEIDRNVFLESEPKAPNCFEAFQQLSQSVSSYLLL